MIKSRRDSGQSVVIGALLLLALFVGFLAWFQITQIPILNQDSESSNNDIIRSDMFELQEKSYDSIINNNVNQISFETRVVYEYQIAGFQEQIGVFSIDEFDNNPVEFRNGNTTVNNLPDEMISLRYTPSYIERTEVPFIYENGVLIENQTTTGLDKSGQRFIRGNNIYVFEFETSFVALQSPNPTLVTVPERELQETDITGVGEEDIEIEFETTLSVDIWDRLLNDQQYVMNVEDNNGSIIVTLDGSEDYTVHTGKVRIEQ